MTSIAVPPDPKSLVGKLPPPDERAEIVVIGAGVAGIAAAIEAARQGAAVKLIDENPISGELLGLDVPLFYGQRATAAVQAKERMLEQIFTASPALEEAFEAGVDIMLGVYAWGAFVNGTHMRTLPGPVIGLADEARSWLLGFDRLILATGARDLVYFFAGADQPGVMGAQALHALLQRYDAFSGQRIVFLGTSDLAVSAAHLALDRGIEVAAMIEVRDAPQSLGIDALRARGVEVLYGHVIKAAEKGTFGVTGAVVASTEDGIERRFACDTICIAVDRVPVVELADVAGARLELDAPRGGYVPVMPGATMTTLPLVFVAGDCAGLKDSLSAEAEGRWAARAALRSLGRDIAQDSDAPPVTVAEDRMAYRLDWMRALLAVGTPEVLACQCEDVTRADLLGVKPPRYLGPNPGKNADRDLQTLSLDGPISQDQIKRLTRACMGACQARRCREQVAMMLAIGAGVALAEIPLAGYRAPVRPLSLSVLDDTTETEEMRAGWDVWFGIPTQWVPYADIGTEREADFLDGNMHL